MAKASKPLDCPRCGRAVAPAAGLYFCGTCGGFANRIRDRDRHFEIVDAPTKYAGPIDGRAIPLTRKIK